jgi:putative ABC transport system permease protein
MLRLKLRALWNRELDQDLDDELRSHIEMKAEELEAEGMPPAEAMREARRRFGNLALTAEKTRDLHIFSVLDNAIQDLKYGIRRLRREPAFTLAAVLTLGLVIGANGAIFSVLEAVLLRPLPFAEPHRLIEILATSKGSNRGAISIPDLEDIAAGARTISGIAAEEVQSVNYTGVAEPGRLIGGFVSGNYFDILGVRPILGRGISATDEKPGGPNVLLLNYAIWRDRFGSDAGILGRSLILNNQVHTIIGVLPESFRPQHINAEVWMPVRHYPAYSRDRARASISAAMARLAPGATEEQARAELTGIMSRLAQEYPASNRDRGLAILPLSDFAIGAKRNTVLVLAAAVTCVLLLGCANIAGLLLTKAASRRQEMAIRASLGAKTGRLMTQLLTESLLLAVAGGALGMLLAAAGMQLLATYSPDLIGVPELRLNLPVVAYLAAISILTGVLFGLAPAFAARRQAANFLRQRGTGSAGQRGFQNALVAGQVALALVLLISAGLMATSVRNVAAIHPGFNGERVLTMEYRLPRDQYKTGPQQSSMHQQFVDRVAGVPGVESVGLIGALPFSGNSNRASVQQPDRPEPLVVGYNPATPGYFTTAGVPLLEGRDFATGDGPDSQPVAIVSRTFADQFWTPGQSPLGRQVKLASGPVVTVVGVVGDVKQNSLDDAKTACLYRPYAQDPYTFATLVVRTQGDPLMMTKSVKQAIWSADKDQPLWKIRTMQSLVDRSYSYIRYLTYFLGCFALLALVLAAIGLYGLLSYAVQQRTAELGVRMAIGAAPADILRLVVRGGLLLTAAGIVAGIAAALLITQILKAQVYGVATTDPAVYASVAMVLLAVALIAVWLPARRAMRVDPVIALRQG